MYKKQKTYTLPVENREVIVPNELLPDDTKRCFIVMGEETEGTPTEDGILVAYSDNEEEVVTIKYDYEEESDEVTPIVDAIKAIPETVIPEADYSSITEALKNVEDAIFATESDATDISPVVEALTAVKQAVELLEIPEAPDYTNQLKNLLEAIPEGVDTTKIESLLQELNKEVVEIELPERLINDNRVKVEVDRIGMNAGISDVARTLIVRGIIKPI